MQQNKKIMDRRYGMFGNAYALMKTYKTTECIKNYFALKTEIEQKIDDFNKIRRTNIYTQWDKLNKQIITKDQELKECYDNGYISARLNNEEKIKNFKNKCNSDGTCNNGAFPARKPPVIKPTTQGTCKENKGCKNQAPQRVDVKSQSKLTPVYFNSKSSERKDPHEQGQNQGDAQQSRKESVVLQPQSGSTPSDSFVGTNGKTTQEIVDHHFTSSGMAETQKQQLNASSPSEIRELDSSPGNPSECVFGKDSGLTCTSTGEILDTKGFQTNRNSGKSSDTNKPETQDSAGNVIGVGTGGDKDIIRGAANNLSSIEGTPGSVQSADEDSLSTTTDIGSTGAVDSDPENTGTEEDSSASLASSPSGDEGNSGITEVDISNDVKAPDGESHNVIISHDHRHDSRTICNESTCRETRNNELTDDGGDKSHIFNQIFSTIQANKGNVIKTSIPMGIVLLLSLLFK
ncbi:PIR protein, partial [Plasmodium vivax]